MECRESCTNPQCWLSVVYDLETSATHPPAGRCGIVPRSPAQPISGQKAFCGYLNLLLLVEMHPDMIKSFQPRDNGPQFKDVFKTDNSRPGDGVYRGGQNRGARRKLILCFDGTGNKFRGDESDSNILKIFRMLDSSSDDQCK